VAAAEATDNPSPSSKTTAAKAATASPASSHASAPDALPPAFIDSLRVVVSSLAADVTTLKNFKGDAAALAPHAVFTQQQLYDEAVIQSSPVLKLFYGATSQSLHCMFHIAQAFKSGNVMDKSSTFSKRLGLAAEHYKWDSFVEVAGDAAARVTDYASHFGAFESAAHVVANVLDSAAAVAEGIPIASVVIKCISFTVNKWTEKKFDVRMNRLIACLYPDLDPVKWTSVAQEVSRRLTVAFASDIEALHSGAEENRGRVKNWFRDKCAEYGLAHLTSKADDAVVMMALQKVELFIQLALGGDVPAGLVYTELADVIVSKLAPFTAAAVSTAAMAAHASPSSYRSSSPPPVTLHEAASHSEVEKLRRLLEETQERDKKEMANLRQKLKMLETKDQDKDSSGGGLVLASSKSEVNAETANTAATQTVRHLQQQQNRTQQQVEELTAFFASHLPHNDPVLKVCLKDLNAAVVRVMKKHDDIMGWQERYMAVRKGAILYGRSRDDVLSLADSTVQQTADQHYVINLAGCSVAECLKEDDKDHYALLLTTSEVSVCCDTAARATSAVLYHLH
jgi:hypothetical protein